MFEKMIISGRYDYGHWISSYRVNYSSDGINWLSYKNSQIFTGNSEYKEPVQQVFEPFIARSVRILPVTWNQFVGGKFEFYISEILYSQSLPSNTLIRSVSSGFKLTASSVWDNSCEATRAGYDIKINGIGFGSAAWCAAMNDQYQWIMISSTRNVIWKRIGTMGDSTFDQRVTSYYITYTVDGSEWIDYKSKQIFQANNDRSTAVEYDLDAFQAVAIRLHPISWTGKICMRVEAYCIET